MLNGIDLHGSVHLFVKLNALGLIDQKTSRWLPWLDSDILIHLKNVESAWIHLNGILGYRLRHILDRNIFAAKITILINYWNCHILIYRL